MSTTRQPQSNRESFEALRKLFQDLATDAGAWADPHDVWLRILANPWFQTEIRLQATALVGRAHLDEEWCQDVAQEVVVILQAKLATHCDLLADAEELPEHCAGWLASIIRHAAYDALKRQIGHCDPALAEEPRLDPTWQCDLRLDLLTALEPLSERERDVVLLYLQRYQLAALHLLRGAPALQARRAGHGAGRVYPGALRLAAELGRRGSGSRETSGRRRNRRREISGPQQS